MTPTKLPKKLASFVLFITAGGKVFVEGGLDEKLVCANFAHTTIKMTEEQI